MLPERITVLGLGLIGGSVGLSIRQQAPNVVVTGWDPSESVRHEALRTGVVQACPDDLETAVAEAKLIVLAPPLNHTLSLLRLAATCAPPTALFTDVGSTKAGIVEGAEQIVGGRFLGGHPLAGHESSGIGGANADLFANATWLLTPTATTYHAARSAANWLASVCGAKPRALSPADHDKLVAAVSHLPHMLAFCLASTAAAIAPEGHRGIAGGSFRDGTRVARSSPGMWREILVANRTDALGAIDAAQVWLAELRGEIEASDGERIEARFRAAREDVIG